MNRSLLRPCARWADALAAQPDDLSLAERAALDAHVLSCAVCTAVRADYRRMDAGIRSLPAPRPLPGLPLPLLALLEKEGTQHAGVPSPILFPRLREDMMQLQHAPGVETPRPTPLDATRHPRRRRLISAMSAVAAVLVIAVVTFALLASHTAFQTRPTTGNATATKIATLPPNAQWTPIQGLLNTVDLPILAPSNPQVVYEISTLTSQIQFQRSVDAGAHWQTFPMPSGADFSTQQQPSVFVSPFDAHTVFLTLPTNASAYPQQCPPSQGQAAQASSSSGVPCSVQFYSKDDGVHWSLISLPQPGALGSTETFTFAGGAVNPRVLRPQGNRLYSVEGALNQGGLLVGGQGGRLVTSIDGGITWQVADASLAQQGYTVCDYAPTPTGSTVFALAQQGTCQSQERAKLWRSDDAGKHWALVGPAPENDFDYIVATSSRNGGQPILYLLGTGAFPGIQVSIDGGKTWQTASSQGFPTGGGFVTVAFGVLPDGSITWGASPAEVSSFHQTILFLAWKYGDAAWRQVAPPLTVAPTYLLVQPSDAKGQTTLWVVLPVGGCCNRVEKYTLP